jgi:F0F1-type ATP synthase membrane subunit b/b'
MTKFGILKSKMEQKLLESYSNGTFPQEMKKFKKLVLENKKISKLHFLYDELSSNKGMSKDIVDDYINECITIYENTINKIDMKEFNPINEWVKNSKVVKNNYENIDNVMSSNILTLGNKIQSKKLIAESLKKSETKNESVINLPLSTMVNVANKTLQKFVSELNESDKKEVVKLLSADDEELQKEFQSMKESVVSKLTEMKSETNDEIKSSIEETINKINEDTYDKLSYYKLKMLNENL